MNYDIRQEEQDKAYTGAYAKWVNALSPLERARLVAEGLAEPDTSRSTSKREHDVILELAATPEATPAEHGNGSSQSSSTADALASFCARIRSHPNPLLALDAACFASGLMDVEGKSETELAERHGVTRAAFSRLVVNWSQTFDLQPSRGMRSKKARMAYRNARLRKLRDEAAQ